MMTKRDEALEQIHEAGRTIGRERRNREDALRAFARGVMDGYRNPDPEPEKPREVTAHG